jgi:lipid-binding SYLF domain-containing protein
MRLSSSVSRFLTFSSFQKKMWVAFSPFLTCAFSYALFFMDPQALQFLDKSDGWAVGSDPSVVVIDKGAGASFDSTTLSHKVIAIPFGQNELMAGLALQGSKITTYNPNA